MIIYFAINTADDTGMNVGDWFQGGWDTIDAAEGANTAHEADEILSGAYLGPDGDGVDVSWVIKS